MRTVERIGKYLETEKKAGRLQPGSRLPTYHELMKIGKGSYATVLTAMKKLQTEGIVEIRNGTGSFLAGGRTLKICISHTPSTISAERFSGLLNKYAQSARLNMEFEIFSSAASASINLKKMVKKYDALITIQNQDSIYEKQIHPHLPFTNEECEQLLKTMIFSSKLNEFLPCLPFTYNTVQIGVNTELLKKTGFSIDDLTPGFEWWDRFLESCRIHKIIPVSMTWREQELFFMKYLAPLLLSQVPFEPERYRNEKPLFATENGLRFLNMLKGVAIESNFRGDPFYERRSVFQLAIGAWIAVQNNNPEWPEIKIPNLEIIPYRDELGRKICYSNADCIGTYLQDGMDTADRGRIRELLTIMLSRDFQLEYCNMTGMLSFRKDISSADYEWNRNDEWNAFFPEPDSVNVFPQEVFPDVLVSVLTSLLEGYLFYGINPENTARRMDHKKSFESIRTLREKGIKTK